MTRLLAVRFAAMPAISHRIALWDTSPGSQPNLRVDRPIHCCRCLVTVDEPLIRTLPAGSPLLRCRLHPKKQSGSGDEQTPLESLHPQKRIALDMMLSREHKFACGDLVPDPEIAEVDARLNKVPAIVSAVPNNLRGSIDPQSVSQAAPKPTGYGEDRYSARSPAVADHGQ